MTGLSIAKTRPTEARGQWIARDVAEMARPAGIEPATPGLEGAVSD